MCGGLVGDVFGGVDKLANSINPMKQPMQWLTDNTVSKVFKPAGQAYDYSNSHPLESLIAMMAAGAGASALGGGAGAGEAGAAGAAGAGAEAGAGAGAADAGSINLFADAVPGAAGDVGATAGGMSGLGADTAGIGMGEGGNSGGSFLSSLLGGGSSGGGGFGLNLGTAKNGLGAMQVLSSLYGMEQSRKLQKGATSGAMSKAGLQAVQRSMAAQGYQGSGNMMQALSKYGADAYSGNLAQQQAGLSNTMSSLGLLTAGIGNMAGWGGTGNKP